MRDSIPAVQRRKLAEDSGRRLAGLGEPQVFERGIMHPPQTPYLTSAQLMGERLSYAGRSAKVVLFAATLVALCSSSSSAERCVSPEVGRQMLESGEIAPFPEAARRAGIRPEHIEGVELCPSNGRYTYEVDVFRSPGSVREVISAEPDYSKPTRSQKRERRPH
jgi:hypothetical protein